MCANIKYPSLGWKWDPSLPLVHVYCKMLWDNKYKEDYELICNGLFPHCIKSFSVKKHTMSVKEYGDWYMIPDGVYIRIVGITKPPHWLPHPVHDTLLLQEMLIKHM